MACSSTRVLQKSTAQIKSLFKIKSTPSISSNAFPTPRLTRSFFLTRGYCKSYYIPNKPTPSLHTKTTSVLSSLITYHNDLKARLPVELAGGESLMPLHSATASSLLKSMLSSKIGQWGSLSEGFATPL